MEEYPTAKHDSYFQIDRPLAKKLHKAEPERTTCGPEYFMMRVRTALDPTLAASPITAEDAKLEVRICPPKSAPRDFSREGPIDLKVAVIGLRLRSADSGGRYTYLVITNIARLTLILLLTRLQELRLHRLALSLWQPVTQRSADRVILVSLYCPFSTRLHSP